MKQYTSKDQTAKLIELGFPKPKSVINEHKVLESNPYAPTEFEYSYSIGELIEFLQSIAENNEVRISTRTNLVSFDVMTEDGRCGYSFNEDELIDSLYEACVTIKEEII
jgi:hypothetical protein